MAARNNPIDQYLKIAYANVIANQLPTGPTWQDAQQATAQQSGVTQSMQMPLKLNQYLPPASQQVAEAVARTKAAQDMLAYHGFGTYGAPEVQRAATAAPKPTEPEPTQLTYQEFHDIAAAAVKDYPKIKLVTDSTTRCGGEFVAWLSFGKHESVVTAIKEHTRAEVENLFLAQLRLIRNLVGAEALQ